MGGRWWLIFSVRSDDPVLLNEVYNETLATTDLRSGMIFIANNLDEESFAKVLAHELAHVALYSYGPRFDDLGLEETICNAVSTYGPRIYELVQEIL